jgi:hypothetical protein
VSAEPLPGNSQISREHELTIPEDNYVNKCLTMGLSAGKMPLCYEEIISKVGIARQSR